MTIPMLVVLNIALLLLFELLLRRPRLLDFAKGASGT
jgi:hypothetical protein